MNFYTQQTANINGRSVWHYLIDCPIGYIQVVQYEQPSMELKRFIFDGDTEKAERKFAALVKGIASGRL